MQQIAQKQLDNINRVLGGQTSNNDTFTQGKLGLIYYYYHLYKVTESATLKQETNQLLQQVFSGIYSANPTLVGPSLSTGGAGFGYTVNLMHREGFLQLEAENELDALDDYLFKTARGFVEEDNIDYLHGALGVVQYFSGRQQGAAKQYADVLIEKICKRAVQEEAGCWFRNNLIRVDGKQVINFSLSHGLCGILLTLLKVHAGSAHKELIANTVKEGIRFILKHKIDVDFSRSEYSFFPLMIARDAHEIITPDRMGWSCGDLNEVLLFYRAAKLFGDDGLLRLANLIGMQSMMRKDGPSTQATTAAFCHGAAGLAQSCRILHKETGFPVYRDGYEHWLQRTILLLEDELPKGVYAGKEEGLLDGLTGIALTLLSYISDKALNWSSVLLL